MSTIKKNSKRTTSSSSSSRNRTGNKPEAANLTAPTEHQAAALNAKIAEMKAWLGEAHIDGIKKNYRVAAVVQKVLQGPNTYGEGAVLQIEKALSIDSKTLYRWAGVAAVWSTESKLEEVLAERNTQGLPLTWSHLELLAGIKDGQAFGRCLATTIAQSLSVRDLRQLIKGAKRTERTETAREPKAARKSDANAVVTRVREEEAWRKGWIENVSSHRLSADEIQVLQSMKEAYASSLALIEQALGKAEADPGDTLPSKGRAAA